MNRFASIQKYAVAILGIAAPLALWYAIIRIWDIRPYILPPPHDVLHALVSYRALLWSDLWLTVSEAVTGLLVGSIIGILCGTGFHLFPVMDRAFRPYFVALQSVPIVAVAPFLIMIYGSGWMVKVIMSALICFFPVAVAFTVGMQSVPPIILNLLYISRARAAYSFFYVRLPYALPQLFTALKVSSTLAVIGAVVAEISGSSAGLGYRISVSCLKTEPALAIAALLWTGLCSIALYYLISLLGYFLAKRYPVW